MDPARLKQVGDRLDVAFHDAVVRESERPEHQDDEGAWALTAGVLSAAMTIWVSQYADLLDHHARRAGRQLPEDGLDAAARRIAQAVSDAGVAAFEREGRRFGLQVVSPAEPRKEEYAVSEDAPGAYWFREVPEKDVFWHSIVLAASWVPYLRKQYHLPAVQVRWFECRDGEAGPEDLSSVAFGPGDRLGRDTAGCVWARDPDTLWLRTDAPSSAIRDFLPYLARVSSEHRKSAGISMPGQVAADVLVHLEAHAYVDRTLVPFEPIYEHELDPEDADEEEDGLDSEDTGEKEED